MEYAHISAKFPAELDAEIEQFVDETGLYTNKSEFLRDACREHLEQLHEEPAVAALRLEQLLARAEQSPVADEAIDDRLDSLRERVDIERLADATEAAREDTADQFAE